MCHDPKPILKKKTTSEAILQRSLSQHTLLQHAGAILKAREEGNIQSPSVSSASGFRCLQDQSGSPTPTATVGTPTTASVSDITRRIHFNDEVVQCIAVDSGDEDEYRESWPTTLDRDTSSDDVDMTEQTSPSSSASSKSLCNEKKTIAPLPSTTLKYRPEAPELPTNSIIGRLFGTRSSPWSSIASSGESHQPPSEPSANFLMDYEGYDDSNDALDLNWKPRQFPEYDDDMELDQSLDLTFSDTLSFGDYGEASNAGVFDRVLDSVNTAKDIAHVIWNVGWRR